MCRETINITKRILLRGSGQLGDTKIDQRANCPTFRVGRSAVILNIEVDMTGFREAVLITGTDRVCPVLQNCSIGYVIYQLEHKCLYIIEHKHTHIVLCEQMNVYEHLNIHEHNLHMCVYFHIHVNWYILLPV